MPNTNETLGGGGFHHVAIRSRDFDKTVDFYTNVLGFTTAVAFSHEGKRAAMLDTGDGNYLEVFERPDQAVIEEEAAIIHFAIRVSDCKAALERVREAGMQITMEPTDVTLDTTKGPNPLPIRIAFFKGPDGEVVEFFENELT